jgi:dTDP-4-amino-4,6-dideoxygalactose transaminase
VIRHSRPTIRKKDLEAVLDCMVTDRIGPGQTVVAFERAVAKEVGTGHGVATVSGTAALHLAFLSLGVGEGDEVILPSYMPAAALCVLAQIGARPTVVDIVPETYQIDVDAALARVGERTKAILVPHMFGIPADVQRFESCPVPVVEECSHALGAAIGGRKVGSFGTLAVLSFAATRLVTSGVGGMVLTNNTRTVAFLKDLRNYDEQEEFKPRFSYEMPDFCAALGLRQIEALPVLLEARRKIAELYHETVSNTHYRAMEPPGDRTCTWYRYVVRTEKPIRPTIDFFRAAEIEVKRPVYRPLHRYLGLDPKSCPASEEAWMHCLSVPIYPSLQRKDVETIRKALRSY